MKVQETSLPGVLILEPVRFGDHRGFFAETWSGEKMLRAGFDYDFVQDNQSFSHAAGTVRGLHFQAPPHAQDKLVRCGKGRIFDVAVDVRKGSPTFGKWAGTELSFDNGRQMLVPAGFLHGFMTFEPDCEVLYKCTDYYAPECEGAVRWDSCGIEWPDRGPDPVISGKDRIAPSLSEFVSPFVYEQAS
jgi:dTDP-4-dehydrorhamnose 3,5-epimerase